MKVTLTVAVELAGNDADQAADDLAADVEDGRMDQAMLGALRAWLPPAIDAKVEHCTVELAPVDVLGTT
jgi:hypothetical protein